MAGKLKWYGTLANETVKEITKDAENWKNYLHMASRLYRYHFSDQLLIYAQNPNATACAPLEVWNEKMHRWVKAGSKGIALIHARGDGSPRLDYVFDVGDTYPVRGARDVSFWELREEYDESVLEALEGRYGGSKKEGTAEKLMEIAGRAAEQVYRERLEDFEYGFGMSSLEIREELEEKSGFKQTLVASVQYSVLVRCGFNPDEYLDEHALDGITGFAAPADLYHLGDACSSTVMQLCTMIRDEIGRAEKERPSAIGQERSGGAREAGRNGRIAREPESSPENNQNTLAENAEIGYSGDGKQFNALIRKSIERGNGYDRTDLHENGGLPDTRIETGQRGGAGGEASAGEIRQDEGALSEGAPARDVQLHAADREAGGAPAGSGREGAGSGGRAVENTDGAGRSGREAESGRSDDMGGEGQQPYGAGGGDGAAGDGLRIEDKRQDIPSEAKTESKKQEAAGDEPAVSVFEAGAGSAQEKAAEAGKEAEAVQLSLFPTVMEQVERIADIRAAEKRTGVLVEAPAGTAAFVVPEMIAGYALTSGGNEMDSISKIVAFFQTGPTAGEAADFLKEAMNGGKGVTIAGTEYALWYGEDGIRIAAGRSAFAAGSTVFSWEKAAELIEKRLGNGSFAPQEILDQARDDEFHRLSAELWYLCQDMSQEARERGYLPVISKLYGGFPESVEKISALIGDESGRKKILGEVKVFAEAWAGESSLMRFRFKNPKRCMAWLERMDREPRGYTVAGGFEPAKGSFITEDEIDEMLKRGGNISEGKMRIASYFMQGHDGQERKGFLREEYGTGGGGSDGYDEWHDSKGIKFKRADHASGYEGYDTVFLTWDAAQKRIGKLIEEGRYLNEKERASIPKYEMKQLSRSVYNYLYYEPKNKEEWNPDAPDTVVRHLIEDSSYHDSMYEDMQKTLAAMTPDMRGYDLVKKGVEDFAAYLRGEYSLFTPLSKEKLQAEREAKAQGKEAGKENTGAKKEKTAGRAKAEKPVPEDGGLEAAARALMKKQRQKENEEIDGQLSFDFSAMGVSGGQEMVEAGDRREVEPKPEATAEHIESGAEPKPEATAEHIESGAEPKLEATAEHIESEPKPAETERREESEARDGIRPAGRNLTPNVREYMNLKAQHKDRVAGVRVGEYFLFYGDDALTAAKALDSKVLERDVPEMGRTYITGVKAWQPALKKLLEHGSSVLFAEPDPAKGDRAPYQIIKDRDISEYIPLGMKIMVEGRLMQIDSIDFFNHASVQLKDLEVQGWYPIFRTLPIPYVRECVEQELERTGAPIGEADLSADTGEKPERGPKNEGGIEERLTLPKEYEELEEAKRLIEGFVYREFLLENIDYENLQSVWLAYKTTEDNQYEVVAEADLIDFTVNQYLNSTLVKQEKYGSLREMIDKRLSSLDYADLVALDDEPEALLDRFEAERQSDGARQKAKMPKPELPVIGKDEELEEAKRLIEDFCFQEYQTQEMDFSNPEHIGIAYITTLDEEHEITVEVNLVDFSVSQLVDDVVVKTDTYGSMRELIDSKLVCLDFNELVRLDEETERRLGIGEAVEEDMPRDGGQAESEKIPASVPKAHEFVEKPVKTIHGGAYDIVLQKLSVGPELHNFHITDENLGAVGQKTRYQDNVAAIATLKKIEAEGRLATAEEQEVLAKYSGWGSLASAFDEKNETWSAEYGGLKELLTEEEYESARSTVLNAHYTSPTVIHAIYDGIARMGYTPGNILEPSCGIGNFFGLVPEGMEQAGLYGVELDSLTGRIAKQLYQKADITVGGFETVDHPDDFFDLAIGNVPFGDYKVFDRRYNKLNFNIHDYFLVKALDKIRPGGIAAFVTTKGTLDKAGSTAREELAKKADLLGAIRLPNNAFFENAGTSVTTDILFFQKRGSAPVCMPEWVGIGETEDGVPINRYFLEHPEMVLGKMSFWRNMYGNETETACLPIPDADLKEQLAGAVAHISMPDRELLEMDVPVQEDGGVAESIPADPDVRNFSYVEKDGKLYFRENSRMGIVEAGKTQSERIRGLIAVRDSVRELIDLQTRGAGDDEVEREQENLNRIYDGFQKKYGLINSSGNRLAFRADSSYPLLCSLEVLDEEGKFERKADMFTKRTIRHRESVKSVDTAVEALGVSVGERAGVDLAFMASLMGGPEKIPQIVSDLRGIIFKDPLTGPFDPEGGDLGGWKTADEYLSGNVRAKLLLAKAAADEHPEFSVNVEALKEVQPKELSAAEITVRIGAPWVDTKYYKQFLFELLQTPPQLQNKKIDLKYSDYTGEWRLTGKTADSSTNARAYVTYGTKRVNAYEIFEASLNQRSVRIYDMVQDPEKGEIRVLNEKETAIAQQKQDAMKEAFKDWIFRNPERREDLCYIYNAMYNSTRPREYDGSHIVFAGMTPEITLEEHQRNAVARILYGGNTLLAHVVGAGKTYEMVAAAMESKRLGLCSKSMIVVPNHLTEQWGSEFLKLYPGAKVLVATRRDFEPHNRRKFCARIATGDYDAVIIGHSQFEKIPISLERQEELIREQIEETAKAIAEASEDKGFTVKQMERTKKRLENKLRKLLDKKKDDTVYFEELGVDRLFVDEAHSFKNLFMATKMTNVAGISQTDAQKSSDMYAKCRYMDQVLYCEVWM